MTWFESDEGKKMYKLGSGAPDNGCVCSLKNECEAGKLCFSVPALVFVPSSFLNYLTMV